uniref:Uncharacterized protein n=1 Tax=Arundo donax TaxID=35708 RepID=A0A0A9ED62_ARUDO
MMARRRWPRPPGEEGSMPRPPGEEGSVPPPARSGEEGSVAGVFFAWCGV